MEAKASRRKSRELALQVLFQREFLKDISYLETLAVFKANFGVPDNVWQYARLILDGLETHQPKIDEVIQAASQHWQLQRMALVDLNILRLASFELLELTDEVPAAVVINEAVEMAKKYSTSDSTSFINGVLDEISRKV